MQRMFGYEILRTLSSHGDAQVLLAKDEKGECFVLRADVHENVRRQEQVYALASSCSNILHPLSALHEAEYSALVFPHLACLRDNAALATEQSVIAMALCICNALAVLHKSGIGHFDIKPGNIFISSERYLLGDFDSARAFGKVSQDMRVTPEYAAPEVLASGKADARADIYSLGVTMRVLLGKEISAQLAAVIEKACRKVPGLRWQSAEAMQDKLLKLIKE